jgi:hypothetical protein
MNKLSLLCIEIVPQQEEDSENVYYYVNLLFQSNDPAIAAGGNLSFMIADASGIEVGKYYDLALNEVTP